MRDFKDLLKAVVFGYCFCMGVAAVMAAVLLSVYGLFQLAQFLMGPF